jgi:hypothetical protein
VSRYQAADACALYVVVIRGSWSLPAQLAAEKEDCAAPAVAIPEAGEAAKYCSLQDIEVNGLNKHVIRILVGKHGHGQTRIAVADVQAVRVDVYAAVAKLLGDRL